MINISSECPRYEKCAVNNCPLHIKYPDLFFDKEDAEQKCTMEKNVRLRIGSKYWDILKYQGLTTKEWAARERYNKMSEEEKEKLKQRGTNALSILRNKVK